LPKASSRLRFQYTCGRQLRLASNTKIYPDSISYSSKFALSKLVTWLLTLLILRNNKWRNNKWNGWHNLCYIGIGTYNILLSWGGFKTYFRLGFGFISLAPFPPNRYLKANSPLDSRNALTLTSDFTGYSCALAYFTLSGVRLCYEFNNEYGGVFNSFLFSNALLGGYLIL